MDPSSGGAPPEAPESVDAGLKKLSRTLKRQPHLADVLQPRPHIHVPASSIDRQRSDIVDHTTALSVAKVIKRGRTDVPHRTLSRKDPMVYAKELFEEMKASMKAQNLNTSRMIRPNFEFLLPNISTTSQQLTIFEAVRSAPMTVTNVELSRVLDLELSTDTSPPTQADCQHHYIRSWTFTYEELAALCAHMCADDKRLAEVVAWMDVAKLHRNSTNVFTIRYGGTVVGPGRPWDRYTEDLSSRNSGILAEFTRAVDTVAPHVAQGAQIFLLRNASVARNDPVKALSDPEDVERMLIEFLGHRTLLNRQRGGYFTSYLPFTEDVELFKGLKTDAWESFKNARLNCPDEVVAKLTGHFDEVQDYANSNTDLTGTWKLQYSDALRDMSLQQATPYCFSYFSEGITPIVFIGKDITEEAYINATPFLAARTPGRSDHAGQAGTFIRDIIQRLVDDESSANRRDIVPNAFRADRSFWLFYDLWQWLAHKDLEAAAGFLQQYLSIVRPLIAVSFGLTTTNVVLANFNNLNGAKLNSYTSLICTPTIQYYDGAGPTQHRPDSAFINIPMFHPGRDKYGSNSQEIRRLVDISMRYAFLLVDVAGDVLSDLNAPERNRLELCNEILRRMDAPAHAHFFSALQSAKSDCAAYIRTNFSQASTEDVRPVLDYAGRQVMRSLGVAKGDPYSFDRDVQLDEVWDQNMPELHALVPHDEELKETWKETFLPLQEDQYFYLAVLAHLPPDSYLTNLLDTVRPEWAKDDSWVNDKNARDRAIARVQGGLWISRQKEEVRKATVQFPDKPVKAKDLHNHQVGFVDSNGSCTLRWLGADGTSRSTILTVRSAVSKTDFETRTLLFTEHGINVVSGTGEMFRGRLGQQDLATFPLNQVLHRRELYTLWSSVREAHGHTVPPFGAQADASLAKDWGKKKGAAALTHLASAVSSSMNRPPQPLDALYPLNEYINIHFPGGGNFYYHKPEDEIVRDKRRAATAKPQATVTTEDMRQFLEMLDTPEWMKHPYREFWKAELQARSPPLIGLLSKNLPLLRSAKMKTFPRGARAIFWELGPPGSAVEDIFDESQGQSCLPAKTQKAIAKAKASKEAEAKDKGSKSKRGSASAPSVVTAPNNISLPSAFGSSDTGAATAGRSSALQRRRGTYEQWAPSGTHSGGTTAAPPIPPRTDPANTAVPSLSSGYSFPYTPPVGYGAWVPPAAPVPSAARSSNPAVEPMPLPRPVSSGGHSLPYAPPASYSAAGASAVSRAQFSATPARNQPGGPLNVINPSSAAESTTVSSVLRQSLKRSADEEPQTSGSNQQSTSTKKSRKSKNDQGQSK